MENNPKRCTGKKYKTFDETYSLCAFSLCIAFLYPNRANAMNRLIIVLFVILLNGGQIFWFITYTFKCIYALDIYNLARNMTLFVVMLLYFIKTFYIIQATKDFAEILEKISEDLLEANNLDNDYQLIYDEYIKQCKICQTLWLLIPTILSAQFPIYAGICMTIESIQTDDFKRSMVHDMDLMFVEHIQSETPFFECMFAYNCLQCIVLFPNFCGLDGSFCIATTHLCLKLKLVAHKVHRAFRITNSNWQLRKRLNDAIRDHQDALYFYEQIQNVYGLWLFTVFMLTSFMISFNLYQIYLQKRVDPKYIMFGLAGVFHIYLPCYYSSTLTKVIYFQFIIVHKVGL